jgi:predicted ATPase/signal transduction histidine kinase
VSSATARYRVIGTLRESARAASYRALGPDDRPVLLEVLRASPPDRRDIDRFEGKVALVREDVAGTSLAQLVGPALPPERFLPLAIGATRALRELHTCGVIHRDVKPESFIVLDEGRGLLRLAGLGLALREPREQAPGHDPALMEGTLAYMSPEQTGRLQRAVDQRSDLYSLGVTCYELLTGRLPFSPRDPLEWVHCHLARTPVDPTELVPALPAMLSRIVMKLLAKAPEDRYQSATGLLHDLERCHALVQAVAAIAPFPLGERDVSDRWRLSERLYGRAAELRVLREVVARATEGVGPALALVAGYAGAGKSALVNELRRPVVRAGGLFLAGKFDAYARDVPYATFVQALRAFILDLLTESDAALGEWRERLASALGAQAQVMVELIPPLGLVMGKQPPVIELPPAAAGRRFASLFRSLLDALAGPGRPLVLFLDDLQWADAGSLALLEQAVVGADARHLAVIGAYRDNEVDAGHPLSASVRAIRAGGVEVRELPLQALARSELEALIADTLARPREEIGELAALVHDKTAGNPFFARQFLTTLHGDGLIAFNREASCWRWDQAGIAAQAFTSNVAAFLAARVERLPAPARAALALGACLGSEWDTELLAAVLGVDATAADALLDAAVAESLLARRDGGYRFTHDRVRQAAYESIPAAERLALHLRVARARLRRTPAEALDEAIFEVVNQLNLAGACIDDRAELIRAAELNLRAGRRARRSAAFASADGYLTEGAAFAARAGATGSELGFTLDLERAECRLLRGDHEGAKLLLAALLARAPGAREKALVYRARQGVHQLTGEIALAVEDELEGLKACGIVLPAHPTLADVMAEHARVEALLARHPPETLLALPAMTDPTGIAATQLVTPSFFLDPRLFFVHVARMVALSLEHGISDNGSYWFSNYALALTAFGGYREARRLAQAAYQLAERQPLGPRLPEAAFVLAQVSFWTDPSADVVELLRTAYRTGLANGALETPAMCTTSLLAVRLARGDALAGLEDEADGFLALLTRTGARDFRDLVLLQRQLIRRLRGRTRGLDSFDEDGAQGFDSRAFLAALTPDRMTTMVCWCWIYELRAAYLAGQIQQALAAGERAAALGWSTSGLPAERDLVLYRGLSLAAALADAPAERREPWLAELRGHEQRLAGWARLNPATFASAHALLVAELARLEGRADAGAFYDRAIEAARAGGLGLEEALAWELGARYQRAQGATALAGLCLREARAAYLRQDAVAKARQLEEEPRAGQVTAPEATYPAAGEPLDVLAVVKASQAISGEVTAERVARRLIELVLAEGGARKALLLLPRDGGLALAAEANITEAGIDVRADEPARALDATTLPLSLVQYVWRTGDGVVLDDAAREPRFAADDYVARAQPRSVLCTPIRRQGKVVGLLYLENRALGGAFTRRRQQVLDLLAAQAAISLENAALLEHERAARETATAAERRAALLAEASALLSESLDHRLALARLGRLLTAQLADWCMIDLVEAEQIRPIVMQHRDPARQRLMAEAGRRFAPAWSVPLTSRGRALGTIRLGWDEPPARTDPADAALIEEIAQRAAVAVDNGQLFQKSEEAVRLRDEFLSVASHELNTPLAGLTLSVQGLVEQTLREPQEARVSARLAGLIDRQARRLADLVNNLLDVTRLRQRQPTLQLEPLDLGELVRDVVGQLEPQLERAGCAVALGLEERVSVRADRGRLQQVLGNLLSNAMKFGAGRPVTIGAGVHGASARLTVVDRGIGIDPPQQPRLFGPFERGVSASHYGGMGLGLFICRQIVEAHGGTIRVDSQLGAGATFTVDLPLGGPPAARAERAS